MEYIETRILNQKMQTHSNHSNYSNYSNPQSNQFIFNYHNLLCPINCKYIKYSLQSVCFIKLLKYFSEKISKMRTFSIVKYY